MDGVAYLPGNLRAVPVPMEAGDLPVPHYVDCYIREAEDIAEGYGGEVGDGSFIPSDIRYAYQVLQWLMREGRVAKGDAFLEWGSGQGLAAILAGIMGMKATGVEIDERLVKEARELAERYESPAMFIHGSYNPATAGLPVVTADKQKVVYVYPWPNEEGFFLRLFSMTAPAGALLMMCLGPEDIRVYERRAD